MVIPDAGRQQTALLPVKMVRRLGLAPQFVSRGAEQFFDRTLDELFHNYPFDFSSVRVQVIVAADS